MLFNSNVKLLVVLVLLAVLIYMLNADDVVHNEGELELLSEDQVTDNVDENEEADTSVVNQVLDQTSTNEEKNEGNNVDDMVQEEDNMIDSVLNTQVQGNDIGQS